ncbi:MAG: hypothetical protein AAF125_23080 [Chloroflexota bacterium]
MADTQTPTIYRILPSGIHEIRMMESSRAAVDDWLAHMEGIVRDERYNAPSVYVPVLLDLREPGMMPVGYATQAVRVWAERYPNPPLIDIAVVYRYGMLASLAVAFSGLSGLADGVQLFHKGRYEDAQTYLKGRIRLAAGA